MEVKGLADFSKSLRQFVKDQGARVEAARKQAMQELVSALIVNIPVWSGRTIESIQVNNDGSVASLQGPPTRQEAAAFGQTGSMSLGSEPMRAVAEAMARAQADRADYSLKKSVFLTIHSEAWGLVEKAAAPNQGVARNKAVVSELALASVRQRLKFVR